MLGALVLVVVGLVMTALMQSSTAAVAVTLSAYYTGAVGLDQGCASIIGQNIGTATSSALVAIGASTTAQRLAIAYVLFKIIAAVIALLLFPLVMPLLVGGARAIDGVTLLAAYHTAFNVIGVLVLLPLIDRFTGLVERILPERGSPLTRCLDRSALAMPIVAMEAVRRTIARVLAAVCDYVETALVAHARGEFVPGKNAIPMDEAVDALRQAQVFLSDVAGRPDTDDEQRRLTSTLHALDHAIRLAETAVGMDFSTVRRGRDEDRAGELCADAMRIATLVGTDVVEPPDMEPSPATSSAATPARALSTAAALVQLERDVGELEKLQHTHRSATLGAVANGTLTADAAIVGVDALRSLQALARHAWRSTVHLVGDEK